METLIKGLGINGYGLGKELTEDLEGTMKRLREMGFTSFEPDLIAIDDNPTLQKWLKELEERIQVKSITPSHVWTLAQMEEYLPMIKGAGLDVRICHLFHVMMHPGALKEMTPGVIRFSQRTGIRYFVVSFMLGSLEMTDSFLDEINEVVQEMAQHGITIMYHNHAMEYNKIEGTEETIMDYLFRKGDPRLKMEFDIGWCHKAGVDSLAFMDRYRDRIIALHLKDFAGEDFASIGEGDAPLLAAVQKAAAENFALIEEGILIDQDESKGDMMEALLVGSRNALGWS